MASAKPAFDKQFPDSFDGGLNEPAETSVLKNRRRSGAADPNQKLQEAQRRREEARQAEAKKSRPRSGGFKPVDRLRNSSDRAGALNEARRRQSPPTSANKPAASSIREQQVSDQREKIAKKQNGKGRELKNKAGQAISKATAGAKRFFSNLLKSAWVNLVSSSGATLVWIDAHVFLRMISGDKLFCKLGEEWAPVPPGGTTPGTEEANKKIGQAIGTFEGPIAAGLTACGCLLVICNIALIAMIVGFFENPLRAIVAVLKTIVGNLWK